MAQIASAPPSPAKDAPAPQHDDAPAPSSSSTTKPPADAPTSPAAPAESSAPANEAKEDEATGADDDADIGPPGTGPVVDMDVFGQLLEIDDDEEHEFSKTLAFDYITQAEATFKEIEEALTSKDLDALSRKGHFLKGSSAALGLQRVQHSCEAMQHFGHRRDSHGDGPEVSEQEALARCRKLLVRLKEEQADAKGWLESFYKDTAPSA
ncbi:Phosphorelay intermediate protein [Rhodotorula kratochvilovae]